MRIDHLGDALDHWKGCIIGALGEKNLRDLHVLPMFTDENPEQAWTEACLRLYSTLLRVGEGRILRPNTRLTAAGRNDYFAGIAGDNDVFIDPGTGIAPWSGGDTRHVRPENVAALLPAESSRVVMIYQHSSREEDWTNACVDRLIDHDDLKRCAAFAYWAGSASMIFASQQTNRGRLEAMRGTLCELVKALPKCIVRVTELRPAGLQPPEK